MHKHFLINLATILVVLNVSILTNNGQAAEGQVRCLVLGPLAVSGYVAFLEKVAAKQRVAAAKQAASATDLIDLYERVGCPMPPLTRALECLSAALVAPETRQPITQIAERCMREAGMAVR